ncbi:diaminopimelate epimerase [Alloscardovia criceti]|uniref:diaminopimelate epimerase n=1 Tax=Alloscardovia criceti TaxID=356828 RepID=UPI00037FEDBA|nr:diaminopimelate epimerase [Alloscardovia criceti]
MAYPQTVIKAHGTGNDFVIYLDKTGEFEPTPEEIRFLDDRHFGIGGDGLIRLTPPEYVSDISAEQAQAFHEAGAHWFMDYRNADGSVAEMCGNGTRVTAALAMREGLTQASADEPFALATRAGIKYLTFLGAVEGLGEHVFSIDMGPWSAGMPDEYLVSVASSEQQGMGTFVNMGNPHVVSVVGQQLDLSQLSMGMQLSVQVNALPDVEELDLRRAPEVSPQLPEGQNAEFVRIDAYDTSTNQGEATMRVYERGAGETLSCGTGLCATGVVLAQRIEVNNWRIHVPGGTLLVNVSPERVILTGDAQLVAEVTLY